MKKEIQLIYDICEKLNENFAGNLIDTSELIDLKGSVIEYLNTDFGYLEKGIKEFDELDFSRLKSSEDEQYAKGLADLSRGLVNIIGDLQDIDETLTKIHRKFMLLSGEITEEEFNSSLEIIPEDIETSE